MDETEFAIAVTGGLSCSRIGVTGDVDLASSGALWAALEREMLATRPVVLDLSRVAFMDVSGLSVLLRAVRGARASAWSFAVARALPQPVLAVARGAGVLEALPLADA